MSTGGPRERGALWRDLAAVVVQEISDRVRAGQDPARARMDPSIPHEQPAGPAAQPSHAARAGSVGGELRNLVTQGLRATSASISDYSAARERRRVEAPMRRAQTSATSAKLAAAGLGFLSVSALAGGAGALATDQPEAAAPALVVTAGAGAGAFSLVRRGRARQAEADELAKRLGATSASAVAIHGPSAYSIPLPPQSSLAYEPTRRLVAQKRALAELLPDVEEIAPELGPLAEESEHTLATYAERIVKLERAKAASGGSSALDEPLSRAVAQYADGIEAHQKLVEAAATVMAELVTPHVPSAAHDSINDAADRLQGLAEGLRAVRHDIPLSGAHTPVEPAARVPESPVPRERRRRDRRKDAAG